MYYIYLEKLKDMIKNQWLSCICYYVIDTLRMVPVKIVIDSIQALSFSML